PRPRAAWDARPPRCAGPTRPARSSPRAGCADSPSAKRLRSCRCLLHDFLQGGDAALHLEHAVHAEREHAVLHRLLPQLLGRSALQHHAKGGSTEELREQAVKDGMLTLRMDGMLKVKRGITTLEEVVKETAA